jgi:signal transduction histidine kinase
MNGLKGSQIIIAAAGREPLAAPLLDSLRGAGANLSCCVLGQTLWVELSEGSPDLILIVPKQRDVLSEMMIEQLRLDPRTRSVPVALLVDSAVTGYQAGVLTIGTGDVQNMIGALSDAIAPMRRLRECEAQERSLRDQLREQHALAERDDRELREFAHDMRSGLGVIMAFAANLGDGIAGPLDADQSWHVQGILTAVEKATALVQQRPAGKLPGARPLSLRPTSSPPRGQRALLNLGALCDEVCGLLAGTAKERSLTLHCSIDDVVSVWGDPLKLKQVITNLLVNAIEYTPAHGRVGVRVGWSAPDTPTAIHGRRAAEVRVSDTGSGVPAADRERIFEPGYRRPEHAAVPGAGFGLSVGRQIAMAHGGSLGLVSGAGQGSVFQLLLPQDRRQRSRDGALVVYEGDAARKLLRVLETARKAQSHVMTGADREQFIQLALGCHAAVVLAREEQLRAGLIGAAEDGATVETRDIP